jgi:hypothetical protein
MQWNAQLSCYIRVSPSNRYQRPLVIPGMGVSSVHDIIVTSFDVLCLQATVSATIDGITVHNAMPCQASLPDSSHRIMLEFLEQKAREGGFAALTARLPSLPVTAGSAGAVGNASVATAAAQSVAAQQRRAASKATARTKGRG